MQFDGKSAKVHGSPLADYGQSKAAKAYLAAEFAERFGRDGIISVSWNPGNLKSELQKHLSTLFQFILSTERSSLYLQFLMLVLT